MAIALLPFYCAKTHYPNPINLFRAVYDKRNNETASLTTTHSNFPEQKGHRGYLIASHILTNERTEHYGMLFTNATTISKPLVVKWSEERSKDERKKTLARNVKGF